jgi:hypothetical protein
MFLTHFKFTAQPFAERVAAEALWQDDRMRQGLARLRYLGTAGGFARTSSGPDARTTSFLAFTS